MNNSINEIVEKFKSVEAKGELNINALKNKQKSYYGFMQMNLGIHIFAIIAMLAIVGVGFNIFHVCEQLTDNGTFLVAFLFIICVFIAILFALIYLLISFLKERKRLEAVVKDGSKYQVYYAECTECKSINGLVFWRTFKILGESNRVFTLNSFNSNASVLLVKEGDTVTVGMVDEKYVVIY